jgi:hypothetical protein
MCKRFNKSLFLAAVMAAALAGCGGGGGGDSANNGGNPGTDTGTGTPGNTNGPDLQLSVPAPTYAAGSGMLKEWTNLNQAREACGFGLLAQDARLDAAAKAHFEYVTVYTDATHYETAGNTGFTGRTPQDRAIAQGFTGTVSEGMGDTATGLLAAPYHARTLLDDWKYVGLYTPSADYKYIVINPGKTDSSQKLGAGVVANYPCEGALNVETGWSGEEPDPFPDLGGTKGTPVLLRADPGSTLEITNLAIVRAATGESQPFRTITSKNDANNRFHSNEYAAVPIARLEVNETYTVTYQGTLDGKPVGKTFSFKTSIMSGVKCKNPTTGEIYQCNP